MYIYTTYIYSIMHKKCIFCSLSYGYPSGILRLSFGKGSQRSSRAFSFLSLEYKKLQINLHISFFLCIFAVELNLRSKNAHCFHDRVTARGF